MQPYPFFQDARENATSDLLIPFQVILKLISHCFSFTRLTFLPVLPSSSSLFLLPVDDEACEPAKLSPTLTPLTSRDSSFNSRGSLDFFASLPPDISGVPARLAQPAFPFALALACPLPVPLASLPIRSRASRPALRPFPSMHASRWRAMTFTGLNWPQSFGQRACGVRICGYSN